MFLHSLSNETCNIVLEKGHRSKVALLFFIYDIPDLVESIFSCLSLDNRDRSGLPWLLSLTRKESTNVLGWILDFLKWWTLIQSLQSILLNFLFQYFWCPSMTRVGDGLHIQAFSDWLWSSLKAAYWWKSWFQIKILS